MKLKKVAVRQQHSLVYRLHYIRQKKSALCDEVCVLVVLTSQHNIAYKYDYDRDDRKSYERPWNYTLKKLVV